MLFGDHNNAAVFCRASFLSLKYIFRGVCTTAAAAVGSRNVVRFNSSIRLIRLLHSAGCEFIYFCPKAAEETAGERALVVDSLLLLIAL